MTITIAELERYCQEIKRKHFVEYGLRAFQHPNATHALIITKDGKILGMVNKPKFLMDNSSTRNIIEFNEYFEVTF